MSVVRVTSARLNASTRPVSMSVRLVPPTSGVNTSFDSPNVPWHDAHRASQTFSPLATLPDPAGNPVKSGRTSMSHARISAGVAGRPTPGNSAPVERHVDALDAPAPRPREAGDVVEAPVEQRLPARGRGDHGFAFLDRRVLAQLPVGHQVDVVQDFVLRAERLVADLEPAQPLD